MRSGPLHMGVLLTSITVRHPTSLEAIRGRTVAVDGNLELYQFLSIMRTRDGQPLQDSKGRITSHLNGLAFRTTRLVADFDIRPVFVFDGRPPELKRDEITPHAPDGGRGEDSPDSPRHSLDSSAERGRSPGRSPDPRRGDLGDWLERLRFPAVRDAPSPSVPCRGFNRIPSDPGPIARGAARGHRPRGELGNARPYAGRTDRRSDPDRDGLQ